MKDGLVLGLAVLVLLAALTLGMAFGTEAFSPTEIVTALLPATTPEQQSTPFATTIIREIRLPRVLLAGLCGGLLAGAGAVFQGFFRNPLADSGIMGVSSGAALGAVSSALLPAALASLGTPALAFAGALAAALLVLAAARLHGRYGGTTIIILTGTAASAFFSALTSLLVLMKDRELYKMFVWILGSFNGRGWQELHFILPVALAALALLCLCPRGLDLLGGGEAAAQSLGLNLAATKALTLGAGSLAAAAAVCTGGTIGFVGLIVPHLLRKLHSPRHAILIPASILWGASFLILCDLLARILIPPAEIPVGLVTSLAGAPFFITLLLGGRREPYG